MDDGAYLPTDVLVLIMQRAPPNAHRRLRLVCRHRRKLVDTPTSMSLHSRTMPLTGTKELAPPLLR
jgi:hypothetical protein